MVEIKQQQDFKTWQSVVSDLQLEPHPENGFFCETFKQSNKDSFTGCVYLLPAGETTIQRTLKDTEEVVVFNEGLDFEILIINNKDHTLKIHKIGPSSKNYQIWIPANDTAIFRVIKQKDSKYDYSLFSCMCIPEFNWKNLIMPEGIEEKLNEQDLETLKNFRQLK